MAEIKKIKLDPTKKNRGCRLCRGRPVRHPLIQKHVRIVVKKTGNVINKVSRILPIIGAPKEGIISIPFTVMQSVTLYDAEICGRVMRRAYRDKEKDRNTKVSAYRTVSTKYC